MIPEELYKRRRRHNNTPESTLLIIANYIVAAVGIQLFAMCQKINWFFWVVIGCLALYNFFTIRKNREEYDKVHIYAYVASLMGLVLLFILLRLRATPC
ncbi:hypothetical protein DJ568_12410 [Mucilaginibacter hurinus]|uniref:Uncharacterized protein n=1 Tax=Mucilaginibacter hurinus TaxID=2201324 RepID=A0A367GNL0_9SPHI|nr:hypothetical protein [Mucilaginibacter hurinus]RCH54615.1 hypothetical protein DJ568_12410 [Mucilaginibacter hurinus]